MKLPFCDECKIFARTKSGAEVYPHRKDLHSLKFYECPQCKARVGRHKHTGEALGTLADEELRSIRVDTHKRLDPLWKLSVISRSDFYKILANVMGLTPEETHIGSFTIDQCKEAQRSFNLIKNKVKLFKRCYGSYGTNNR